MPTVTVNGAELHYEDAGEGGPPLVFVHGLWMSGRFFREQVPWFSQRRRTIALDLRGHGQSEKTAAGHTVAQYARDLRAFLEALGIADAVVAGWSMGALVIWDYVEQFGTDRLRAMVDIDQSPTDFRWPDWPHGLLDVATLQHFHSGVQTDFPATARALLAEIFAQPPGESELEWMIAECTQLPPGIASAILFEQSVVDYRDTLPKVTIPTLLCIGRSEHLVPVAAGEYMAEHLPDATLTVFEQSDHCPFLEEPELFNQTVEDWIRALP
jgi:pimeloyl-ACP methyl ester carboxylesterase